MRITKTNSPPIRISKMMVEDIKKMMAKNLNSGMALKETSPAKITEKIVRNPLWKQIVKEEIGDASSYDLRR